MAYLRNTIIKYNQIDRDGFTSRDYFSISIQDMDNFVQSLSNDYFDFYQLEDDDNLEKVSLDIYGDADFWDILLIINKKNPLYNMAFNFDTLVNMAEYKLREFVEETGLNLDDVTSERMLEAYKKEFVDANEKNRTIKIIKPSKIQEFLQRGSEQGIFK